MIDLLPYVVLSIAAFSGALVSGLAGFAFSAVAGAILLHYFAPIEAVPLMMACSIAVQGANLFVLRNTMQWKGSLVFIVGGVVGIPIAVYLLQNADTHVFRLGFGMFVALYATYALFRPKLANPQLIENRGRNALVEVRRRAGRRLDRDARRAADDLVRHQRRSETPAARAGAAIHRRDAGVRAGLDAFAQQRVVKGADRFRHLPAGADRWNGRGYHPVRPHQRTGLQADHPVGAAVFGALPGGLGEFCFDAFS
jgi:hypothetical protein